MQAIQNTRPCLCARGLMSSLNHQKHEKLAVFAFLLTLVIAAGAFYYIWQHNYGLSVAGTQALAEIQWTRQQLQAEQPAQLSQDLLEMQLPCCNYLQHPTRDSSIKITARSKTYCYLDDLTQQLINKGGYVLVDIESGSCPR